MVMACWAGRPYSVLRQRLGEYVSCRIVVSSVLSSGPRLWSWWFHRVGRLRMSHLRLGLLRGRWGTGSGSGRRSIPILVRRIELDRGKAAFDILDSALRRQVRIVIHIDRVSGLRINVRVRAQPLAHLATKQVVDRLPGRLANDVPARHLDTTKHAHHGRIGAELEARAIDLAEHRLDTVWIHPDNPALHHVIDALGDHVGPERCDVTLAVTDNAIVGDELDKDEIIATLARRRITDNESFLGGDLHQNTTTLRSASPRLTASIASLISSS